MLIHGRIVSNQISDWDFEYCLQTVLKQYLKTIDLKNSGYSVKSIFHDSDMHFIHKDQGAQRVTADKSSSSWTR